MASVNEVAKYIIENCNNVTPKKLQKLAYYVQGWSNALLNRSLIDDTNFEAWVHGPVSPELYQTYKKYGWNTINEPAVDVELNFTSNEEDLLNSVIETYGHLSGNELEAQTHLETPWINQRIGLDDDEPSNNVISEDDMRTYYWSIYIGD
ncbi:Panacea domain-containing protein [Staphylococcus hominis]|uniref:Panacea domain-containing protein n=1 Tax=Staphylococcus hominis TaxID=1290 RepID=UPI0011A0DA5D|nr:type II toxin-antitoxin system antitoxin SocA domain-containing protein [Staphylococcus hominis]